MADFAAVLRKTIEGMGETTPEMRARVYEKARATIAAKLAALNPPPPPAAAQRQQQALEDAIAAIERDFAPPPPEPEPVDPLRELEDVFASLTSGAQAPPAGPQPATAYVAPTMPATVGEPPPSPPASPPVAERPVMPEFEPGPAAGLRTDPPEEVDEESYDEPVRRRGYAGLVAAVVAIVALGAGGYGIWLNQNEFKQLLGIGGPPATARVEPVVPAAPAPEAEAPAETATADPAAAPGEPTGIEKFTQRLNEDGTETDVGPAGSATSFGEGTSVAVLTTAPTAQVPPELMPPPDAAGASDAPAATPPAQAEAPPADGTAPAVEGGGVQGADGPAETAAAPEPAPLPVPEPQSERPDPAAAAAEAEAPAAAGTAPAAQLAVGQRAIFYEERTNVAAGSAEAGATVWSLVQESPGGDLPLEPAIRAEADIPGKDVQLRMTIRRNADKSLPASHIIEMIFLTPEGFEGGGIDNVLRIAMKGSEQEAGNPLIGMPAKIADGFFLVALNDSKAEMDANLSLLRRQGWIDVPLVYKSGRRALFTMEKGIPGDRVFDEAIKAWEAASG